MIWVLRDNGRIILKSDPELQKALNFPCKSTSAGNKEAGNYQPKNGNSVVIELMCDDLPLILGKKKNAGLKAGIITSGIFKSSYFHQRC